MILPLILLLALAQENPQPHLPAKQLDDIATILAHDEGWPLGDPAYSLDPMIPDQDNGFDSIGIYRSRHLVRMYSIDRTTGQIVDFMRGCVVFRFKDLQRFEQDVRARTHAPALTDDQLAAKSGCRSLTLIDSHWVK